MKSFIASLPRTSVANAGRSLPERRPAVSLVLGVLLGAPRVLVPLAGLGLIASSSGCVSQVRYEEAKSAADVEAEARRRTALELEATRAKVKELEAELAHRDQRLDAGEQTLEQAKLERGLVAKERDESTALVDQLRGELARANQDMRAYAEENARLARELEESRSQRPSEAAAALARELSGLITAGRLERVVSVRPESNGVVLRVQADALFEPASARLREDAELALERAARFAAARPDLALRLREKDPDPQVPQPLAEERRVRLSDFATRHQLGKRLSWAPKEGGIGAPRAYEIVLEAPNGAG
jgi:hypothetical protein